MRGAASFTALVLVALTTSSCWSLATDVPNVFGSLSDASTSSGGEAGGGRFCARLERKPTLCADFDEGAFDLGFRDSETLNGGTFELEPRAENGRALLVRSPASGPNATAALTYASSGIAAEARASFDFRADSFANRGSATVIASFRLERQGGGVMKVDLWAREKLAIVQDWSPKPPGGSGRDSFLKFPMNEWARIDFHVVLTGTPRAEVFVDGVLQVELPLEPSTEKFQDGTLFELGMRVGPPEPSEGSTVLHFDNVVYDLIPR